MISVVCAVFNEERYIDSCVLSVINQDYPKDDLELIFADGFSTDKTRAIILQYASSYPWIKLIDNPGKIVSTGLNLAIKQSRGEYVIRIDGHATYPSNYLSQLVFYHDKLDASNVGALIHTLPGGHTITARAIAEAMKNPFCVGNSTFRLGTNKIQKVDTVPFGCFRRSLFEQIGFFDEDLVRNQDDEFNGRIIKNGGSIYILPHLSIDYYARGTLRKVSAMFYQYGLFKPLVNKKLGFPATVRQLFPLVFCLSILGALLAGVVSPWGFFFLGFLLLLHATVGLLFSWSFQAPREVVGLMAIAYLVIHISYGVGYLKGIGDLLLLRKVNVSITR